MSLWESACEASLHVESKNGQAYVNLKVGLGQAQTHVPWKSEHGGCHRGGGPAQQRRRERREAERQTRVTAEEAEAAVKSVMENAAEQVDLEVKDTITEEVNGDQDGSCKNIEYELNVEVHEKCKNYDVVEAIEVNFDGTIDDLQIEKQTAAETSLSTNSGVTYRMKMREQKLGSTECPSKIVMLLKTYLRLGKKGINLMTWPSEMLYMERGWKILEESI